MGYCTVGQVQDLVPLIPIGTGVPSTANVQAYIDNRAAEIDAALAALGFSTPIPNGSPFATDLGQLNAEGAAGDVWLAAFVSAPGVNAAANGKARIDSFEQRLSDIRKGIGIPVGQAYSEEDRAPRSYFTDTNAIGVGMDAFDAWGNRVESDARLRMDRIY